MTALAPQADPLLFFGARRVPPPIPPHTGPYYGALAILGNYGYGPRPNQPNNCLFINELDVIDPDTAARGLRDYLARVFPTKERFWHNPPGHLSPGNSDENEEACWREAAPYLHGMMLQAGPPSGEGGDGRTPKEQMTYDLWDMQRRFHGIDSPWGPPVLGADGKPLRLYYREGVTYDLYWNATPEAVAQEWGAAAMTVPHVSGALDGFPVHSAP